MTTDDIQALVTERDEALNALGNVQRMLAESESTRHVGSWRHDLHNDELYWSDQTYLIHGLEPGAIELTSDLIFSLVHPDDVERLLEIRKDAVGNRSAFSLVYRIFWPDGSLRLLHNDVFITRLNGENEISISGAVRDITLPSQSEFPTRFGIKSIKRAISKDAVVINLDGSVIITSPEFDLAVAPLRKGDLIFSLLEEGDSHDRMDQSLNEVERTLIPRTVQIKLDSIHGGQEVRLRIEPSFSSGRFSGFQIQKSQSSVLEGLVGSGLFRHAETSRPLSLHPTIGMWEWDSQTDMSYWSDSMYEILEWPRHLPPISASQFEQLVHPDDRASFLAHSEAFGTQQIPLHCNLRLVLKSGTMKRVLIKAEMVASSDHVVRMVGTFQDLTQELDINLRLHDTEVRYQQLTEELRKSNHLLTGASLRLASIQEEERKRISHQLHDEAGGLLTALQFTLDQFPESMDQAVLLKAKDLTDQLSDLVRLVSRTLRPSVLDRFGMEHSLKHLCEEFEAIGPTTYSLELELMDDPLPEMVSDTIYRIAREGMLNVIRHAQADSAHISLRKRGDTLILTISDDGIGFDHSIHLQSNTSIGLRGIYERAHSVGGTVSFSTNDQLIHSSPKKGTTMEIRIPLTKFSPDTPMS